MYERRKRVFDVLLSGIAMIVLLPLFFIIGTAIFLDDSKGKIIFVQKRIGKEGKPFYMYKFRSMRCDAEERKQEYKKLNQMDRIAFKIENDPRETKIGRILRKTNLDELPQLWNVFIGQMSLVGPRPALPEEVEYYSDYERQRLSVLPGLTCYWQIQPNRHSVSFSEWMEMDMKYLAERSLRVDGFILFQTVRNLWRELFTISLQI